MQEYEFEPLQEAVSFMIEHIFNQAQVKGVNPSGAEDAALIAYLAKTPEDLRAVMNQFFDNYVKLNEKGDYLLTNTLKSEIQDSDKIHVIQPGGKPTEI